MSSNNDYVNRIQVATSKTRTTNLAYNANIPPIFDFANSFSNEDIRRVEDAASFRVIPAQDAEYRQTYESGDEQKAIEMLSDAFLAAYPDNKLGARLFYKGKNSEWKNHIAGYFTDDYEFASYYGNGDVKKCFLVMENSYEYDFKESGSDGDFEDLDGIIRETHGVMQKADAEAMEKGLKLYDGYILRNVGEGYGPGSYVVDDYIVRDPRRVKSAEPFIFDDNGDLIPLSRRFNPESSDIRFRTLDKTEVFNKIRNSKEAIISGDEIEFTPGDDKGNKKKALDYGKRLQGTYINADTGLSIQLQRGRHNGGLNEVSKHDYKNEEHIKSIVAIPQLIENGILIAEVPNEDKPKNPTVSYYQHYVCGLKIGDSEYTVHALIAVDAKGDRYYDHNLISIEKENLLNLLSQAEINNGFGTTPDTKSTTVTRRKFNILISILQGLTDVKARITPAQDAEYKSAVEFGDMEKADRMVHDAAMAAGYNLEAYHGTDVDFNEFKRRRHTNGNIWGSGFFFPTLKMLRKLSLMA